MNRIVHVLTTLFSIAFLLFFYIFFVHIPTLSDLARINHEIKPGDSCTSLKETFLDFNENSGKVTNFPFPGSIDDAPYRTESVILLRDKDAYFKEIHLLVFCNIRNEVIETRIK